MCRRHSLQRYPCRFSFHICSRKSTLSWVSEWHPNTAAQLQTLRHNVRPDHRGDVTLPDCVGVRCETSDAGATRGSRHTPHIDARRGSASPPCRCDETSGVRALMGPGGCVRPVRSRSERAPTRPCPCHRDSGRWRASSLWGGRRVARRCRAYSVCGLSHPASYLARPPVPASEQGGI